MVHSGLYIYTSIFLQKLLIWTAHHTFPGRRHPEVTKNLYYVLLTSWSKIPTFQAPAYGLYWRLKKSLYRACLLLYYFFGDEKQLLRAVLTCTFIRLLLNSFVQNREKYTHLCCHVVDVSRSAEGRVFLFCCERLGRSL